MEDLPFEKSKAGSLGVELELQLIDINSHRLASRAPQLLNHVKGTCFEKRVKPEITQSMIEINSSIQNCPEKLFEELKEVQAFLYEIAKPLNITFCGGGTHPFARSSEQLIYPAARYNTMHEKYRFLCNQATVFGQHVHIGCKNPEDAIYLTHALSRFVSQFIAISASSPFYQGIDTGFSSTRSTVFNSFPTSGFMPMLKDWQEFKHFFFKMKRAGILETMKDVHWDIRPKPEFGTVEIRVIDTPLSLKKAVVIAAYIQILAHFLLKEKPIKPTKENYYAYGYNRFLASRYGLDGPFIDPVAYSIESIRDDVLNTLTKVQRYSNYFDTLGLLSEVQNQAEEIGGDAQKLRFLYKEKQSFSQVINEQCKIWKESTENSL